MVQSGLVGHWPLHEASGRANDLSGNDNHGTVNGPTQGIAGRGGLTAYDFNGNGDYIVGSDSVALSLTDSLTLSAWVKIKGDSSDGANWQKIISKGMVHGDYSMVYNENNDRLQFLGTDSGGSTFVQAFESNAFPSDEWVHVVISWDGSSMTGYVNAESVGTVTETSTLQDSTASIALGADADGNGRYLLGNMMDARIYNRGLSQSEINYLYEIGSVDVATPPAEEDSAAVARYEFDDRSDPTTALDTFGSNDGTINGATYSTDSIRGLSMNFDGSNDYIDAGDTPSSVSNITVSSWFNVDQLPSSDTTYEVLRKENEYILQLRSSAPDTVAFYVYDSSSSSYVQVETTTQISANSWLHAAGSYDGSNTRVYLNGVLEAETSYTGGMNDTTNSLGIGADGAATGGFFDGNIDDVRIYDRALSDEEIHQLYNWGTRGIDRRYELIRK